MSIDLAAISRIVSNYAMNRDSMVRSSSTFNETDIRAEYIDPFLKALGWDVYNQNGRPTRLREVERETRVSVAAQTKRPDYELKLGAERKLFVEAKRPSVDIVNATDPALQVRSYGYSGDLLASVLTNFEHLVVYDTTVEPDPADGPEVARYRSFRFDEYVDRIDEIAELVSKESIYTGRFDVLLQATTENRPEERIGAKFLETLNRWRLALAHDLHATDPTLDAEALGDIAQRFILRVLFLRMCEDRGIHTYERLLQVAERNDWAAFTDLLAESDRRYDTDLFQAVGDPLSASGGIALDTATVGTIIRSLYYPAVPYRFAVIEPEFLGSVYERFLSERIALSASGDVELVPKPEHVDRDVVPTPRPIVEAVVEEGLGDDMRATGYDDLLDRTVLDPACGSGGFLIGAYDLLLDAATTALVREGRTADYFDGADGPSLPFERKREILTRCVYGVDRDYAAVEVARFSLLVKLLEGETAASLPTGTRILPDLRENVMQGDALIDTTEAGGQAAGMIGFPHDWGTTMPAQYDYVVGNPPYLKTEDMVNLEPAEYAVYGKTYKSAHKQYDKYYLFVERAVERLLQPGGRFCMIVSRKFAHIESGKKLRALLSRSATVDHVLDFGSAQLFEGKLTYTCVLRFTKATPGATPLQYEVVADPKGWVKRQGGGGSPLSLPRNLVSGDSPWVLPGTPTEAAVLRQMLTETVPLGDVIEVFNGIQTSRNPVYVIKEWTDRGASIEFEKDGQRWQIEKDVVRPYFDGSRGDLLSFHPMPPVVRVLFPYRVVQNGSDYTARIIPPSEMKSRYPGAWAWLNHNKVSLSKRNMGRSSNPAWYQYGRTQALASFQDRPKLVVGVLSKGDKYVYDDGDVLLASGGTAGECAVAPFRVNPTPYDVFFIQALLSSKAAEYFCRKRGSPFQGDGWFARGTAVLSDLPVPRIDFSTQNDRRRAHDAVAADARELNRLYTLLPKQAGRTAARTEAEIRSTKARMHDRVHQLYGVGALVPSVTLPL